MNPDLWLTADTHFNHLGILKHCSRGYPDVKTMNAAIVEKWNRCVVAERDVVWHLGDFGFQNPEGDNLEELFWKLKGIKNLVVGNHDKKNRQVLRLPWNRVEDLVEIKREGQRATLCHYPLETWPASWHGTLMLHGHCHGTLKRKLPKRFDVGWDVEGGPVAWENLVGRAAQETFHPTDGHE